jgi:hypothetical protein
MRAREVLRGLFDGGRIMVTPRPDGKYVGSCSFLPLVALTMEQLDPPGVNGGSRARTSSCAGPQLDFPDPHIADGQECWIPFDKTIAVGWE